MQPLPQESAGEEGIKQKVIGEPVRVQGHLEFSCLVMVYFSFSVMKGELGWFLEPTDSPGIFLICFLSSPAYCCCRCSKEGVTKVTEAIMLTIRANVWLAFL